MFSVSGAGGENYQSEAVYAERHVALDVRAYEPVAYDRSGWEWVSVEGPVRLAGPDDALDGFDSNGVPALLRDVFVAAGGTHDDWAEYDRVMAAERRTAVLVTPERITSNG